MKLSERFWNKRKGFTIVELVIVIAIIAILAAVLIPTFSNVIQRSKISADTQLCRNLNTVLTMATSEGRIPQSMYDVLYLISESGYLLANLNPTAEGYYYAWDSEGQKMVYIKEDLQTVVYPEDYKIDVSKCWITVGDQAEAERIAAAGYNLYLERDIETIELHNVAVSIDTGGNTLSNLTINGEVASASTVMLTGNFGNTSLNCGNVSFQNNGAISSLTIGSATSGITINGNIGSIKSDISNTVMSSTGAVKSIVEGTTVSNTAGTTFTSASGSVSGAIDGKVSVSTKEAIDNIRIQLGSGRTFSGETVELANDINMAGIAFQPVSNNNRKTDTKNTTKWFQGTFDGKGHTIKNFSNNGFSVNGLNAGTNGNSESFNGVTYNEAVYGLFGTIYVPAGETVTIKDLTIETSIDMIIDTANEYVGDSVGALIGFAYGAGTLNIENVTINGTVKAYDGAAGFIGRAYAVDGKSLTINFKNCTNNATVVAARKAAGFVGFRGKTVTISYTNCTNNGNITCLGVEADRKLGVATSGTDGKSHYLASASDTTNYQPSHTMYTSFSATGATEVLPSELTNNGEVKVADVKVTYVS